jgi:hypothetical protein
MKKLIIILILSLAVFGCADSSDSDTVADSTSVADDPVVDTPITDDPVADEPETETPETGGDEDWTTPAAENAYLVLTGKAEAGPCNLLSSIGAMSIDDNWLMSDYVPGWLSNNDGSFMVRGTFTGNYRFFDFYGTCYSEGIGTNVDGFRLKMVQSANATSHNINNATTLRFALAQKHYTTEGDTYYEDIPGSFIAAKTEIYDYLGFPNATKNFYEMSVTGQTVADAYLFKFELAVTKDRTGSEVGHYLGLMANAIYDNDLDFRSEFRAAVDELLVKEPWDQLKAELTDRGFSVDPAPLWLTNDNEYYTDLMTRTPTVLESANLDQTTKSAIDVSDKNTFAYPVEFSSLESAQYIADELTGDQSLYSVSTCNNGVMDFPCPGTLLLTIEKLREILLPGNLEYNGLLGDHGLLSGTYFIVEEFESGTAPSHTSTGDMVPSGYWNLATIDKDWDNAVCVNNNALSWCRRAIKWQTTD